MSQEPFDLLAIGRSSIDLYSNDVGAPFTEIRSFGAFVGGCPTNVAVGSTRLGLRVALLTAVGDDPVGEFVLAFLTREGVETAYIPKKPGRRTSAVVLGIEPPDRFPLVFYRDNCADAALDIDDVLATPVAEARVTFITGTGLSCEPARSAAMAAAEIARRAGRKVVLDVDFRPDQWHDVRAFGVVLRSMLPLVDIVIGTEDELKALTLSDLAQVSVSHSQGSDARLDGDLERSIDETVGAGPEAVVVKEGTRGATVYLAGGGSVQAPAFPVAVTNILGAGDAFASGFLRGYLAQEGWYRAARMGAAAGAIVVTRQACANSMPTAAELEEFAAARGGW